MTVMEIHTPTGYVITNDVLRAYAQSGNISTMHRAEAYGRKAVFYFDYVSLRLARIKVIFLPQSSTQKVLTHKDKRRT